MAFPSVCLPVRPSVTRRYCVKTTARSTVQFALSHCKNVSSFVETKKNVPKGRPLSLKSWLQVTYPLLIAASLDTFCLAAKFHYIKTVSGKVVAQSIAFRVVSIYWQGATNSP